MSQTLVLSHFYGPFGTRRAETAAPGLSLQLLTEASLNREEDAYMNALRSHRYVRAPFHRRRSRDSAGKNRPI